jgi:hypothetical protein
MIWRSTALMPLPGAAKATLALFGLTAALGCDSCTGPKRMIAQAARADRGTALETLKLVGVKRRA